MRSYILITVLLLVFSCLILVVFNRDNKTAILSTKQPVLVASQSVRFKCPTAITVDLIGNLFVIDTSLNKIYKISTSGVITEFAGSGKVGFEDGKTNTASFNKPLGLAVDLLGNVYVADTKNHCIRIIDTKGIVSTFAGNRKADYKDGHRMSSSFNYPTGLTLDAAGNLYIADTENNRIRKINPKGKVSTIAGSGIADFKDGKPLQASFNKPRGLCITKQGELFIADSKNNRIRKINSNGIVSSIAGSNKIDFINGIFSESAFNNPIDVAVDTNNLIYISDYENNSIRKLTPDGSVYTFAGDDEEDKLGFYEDGSIKPSSICIDSKGQIYAVDNFNDCIRKVNQLGEVSTIGPCKYNTYENGIGTNASFNNPNGLAIDSKGNVYVADADNNRIRKIDKDGLVSSFAGSGAADFNDGIGENASFRVPTGIAIDSEDFIYVTDKGNNSIRKISPNGKVTTIAGYGSSEIEEINQKTTFKEPSGIVVNKNGDLFITDSGNNRICKISKSGLFSAFAGSGNASFSDGLGAKASFNNPSGIAIDIKGNLYVTDKENNRIRKISPKGKVSTLAGSGDAFYKNGFGVDASFYLPSGIAVDNLGNIYVSDEGNNRIRKITPTGIVTTIAGSRLSNYVDGIGKLASFYEPSGIAIDASRNLYISDSRNNRIRKINQLGIVSTFAGTGNIESMEYESFDYKFNHGYYENFTYPIGIAVDKQKNIYVADLWNNQIKKISPSRICLTLAGSGTADFNDGKGIEASFDTPKSLAIDSKGYIYVADTYNNRIRNISPSGLVSTLAGSSIAAYEDGIGLKSAFNEPTGVSVDSYDNIYVADAGNNRIRKITPKGIVTTIAGSGDASFHDGIGKLASFNHPNSISVSKHGYVYVADCLNNCIRKITPNGVVTTLPKPKCNVNDSVFLPQTFFNPFCVTVDTNENIFITNAGFNCRIQKISNRLKVNTFAGSGYSKVKDGFGVKASFLQPNGITIDNDGNIYVLDGLSIRRINPKGYVQTIYNFKN